MWQEFTYANPVGSHLYFVYTPEQYKVGTAVPLLVMLHGCTQTARDFATATAMNQLAEQHGFIVVYPQQSSKSNQNLCWNWFLAANQYRGGEEPARIVHIIQTIQQDTAHWTIDPRRIYVAGLSAGAAMSVILGTTYPDLFAAIGVHSGVEYQAGTSFQTALKAMRRGGPDPLQQGYAAFNAMSTFARFVPIIVFHGTKDTTVAPVNGDQVIQQWIQTGHLASNNHSDVDFTRPASVTSGQVPGGHSYVVATWNTSEGYEVQSYWKIGGMGHAWSGGSANGSYADPRGPSASLAMYTFFMEHPMPKVEVSERPQRNLRSMLARLFVAGKKTLAFLFFTLQADR